MDPRLHHHPEAAVGGYSSVDVTVEFYLRLKTLLRPEQVILDLGAGRGAWAEDSNLPALKRDLLDLRGEGRYLIGCDVDNAVLRNPIMDESHVLPDPSATLPFADGKFDLVLSDWTFEHLADPEATAAEVARVLKPGGWLCARTPNKYGYISMANRWIPESLHEAVLKRGQPLRKSEDVFPTFYRANTPHDVKRAFSEKFDVTLYTFHPEPAYFGKSAVAWGGVKMLERFLPRSMGAVLLIFGRKRALNGVN